MKNVNSLAYVVDTSILLLYFRKERNYLLIKNLFSQSKCNQTPLFASDITLMEVHYNLIREVGDEEAQKTLASMLKLPLKFVLISREILAIAAHYKARGKLSLADSIIAATAKEKDLPLLTKDPEFLQLKDEVKVEML